MQFYCEYFDTFEIKEAMIQYLVNNVSAAKIKYLNGQHSFLLEINMTLILVSVNT